MANQSMTAEAAPPRAARVRPRPDEETPADLVPLRLRMSPGGMVLDLGYPDIVIGRHSEADVRLPLPDVSRRHCRLLFAAGRWHIRDLKSLNGVFVNDELVDETELHDGDNVRIGGFNFVVELEGGSGNVLQRLIRDLPRLKPTSRLDSMRRA